LGAVVFCFLVAVAAQGQDFVAHDPGSGVVTMSGNWRFHTGDDLHWLAPGLDDSGWEAISADEP
jgi:hypothetical protein